MEETPKPTPNTDGTSRRQRIALSSVHCGAYYSLAVAKDGRVLAWGILPPAKRAVPHPAFAPALHGLLQPRPTGTGAYICASALVAAVTHVDGAVHLATDVGLRVNASAAHTAQALPPPPPPSVTMQRPDTVTMDDISVAPSVTVDIVSTDHDALKPVWHATAPPKKSPPRRADDGNTAAAECVVAVAETELQQVTAWQGVVLPPSLQQRGLIPAACSRSTLLVLYTHPQTVLVRGQLWW